MKDLAQVNYTRSYSNTRSFYLLQVHFKSLRKTVQTTLLSILGTASLTDGLRPTLYAGQIDLYLQFEKEKQMAVAQCIVVGGINNAYTYSEHNSVYCLIS